MKVYIVMVKDRHTDPEAHVFATYLGAAAFAKDYLMGCDGGNYDIQEVPGWLFYASYSSEGDAVWITEKELGE